jgi:hypothetical protein
MIQTKIVKAPLSAVPMRRDFFSGRGGGIPQRCQYAVWNRRIDERWIGKHSKGNTCGFNSGTTVEFAWRRLRKTHPGIPGNPAQIQIEYTTYVIARKTKGKRSST